MRRILLFTYFLLFAIAIQAQEKLNYQLKGETIAFSISQEEFYVEFESIEKSTIQQMAYTEFQELTDNSAMLKTLDVSGTFQERKQSLANKLQSQFKKIEPVLIYSDGTRQIAKGELNIKLTPNSSIEIILKGHTFDFQVNEFEENLYLVKLNVETSELFELVNQLQNNNRVEYAEPNFIRMIKPHINDPFFSSQWSINNQGYLGGTVDADMDVDDAWAYTSGSGIKVAVIDEGVDLSHPDLNANLLSGYDATGNGLNGAPNETNNDAHGTACAGIIAAEADNNTGVAGVAYNAKIMPIRIAFGNSAGGWMTNDNWIANGINWAWQNGADVLSNSYGGGSYSSTIANAINNAVNNGRSGKGSVVLFSSGNDNGSVSFPSTVTNAISVGASSMCDERKTPSSCDGENWGSNYGTNIDVVAPGVKIYTTDISGSAGYNSGDYRSDFHGTSAACPNAAGVVALILSANPNLSQQEAREILESSVDKVSGYIYANTSGQPNGTWNNQVGYGRVNALKAVFKALYGDIDLTGSNTICSSSSEIYALSPAPDTVPTWNVSSNLVILLSQNQNSVTVKPTTTSTNGAGYIEAIFPNHIIRKDVWIGKPRITSARLDNGQYLAHGSTTINKVCKYDPIKTNINFGGTNYISWSMISSSHTTTWSQQGDNISFYLWAANHTTTFRITLSNGCGTFTRDYTFNVKDCNGSGNDPCNLTYSVSPNPTSTDIEISPDIPAPCYPVITGREEQYSTATLYDFIGNPILTKSPAKGIMNVEELKPGYYILIISNNGKKESHRVVIE